MQEDNKKKYSRRVLIKYGGNAMSSHKLKEQIAGKIKELYDNGIQVVLVHGGGPFIEKSLKEAGIKSEFFNGQRFTSPEALEQIEKTLKGEVNASLVNIFNKAGLKAVGLSGKDGQVVLAKKRWHLSSGESGEGTKLDLGQVGDVLKVNTKLLLLLLDNGFTPVLTCIASDEAGNDFNINGDIFAGKVAAALKVDDYIVLTDVDGLFLNYPDPKSIISHITLEDLPEYYKSVIQGGMIPKMESCETAVQAGVQRSVLLNGTEPEQITNFVLENQKIGTTLTK
ncbi:MAG TPA: acetylglutamate kinase [Cyclobacteriaceae bacterium]|nr:acetylglutamate kinase [Cyclobacteriaceae bacterium]